MRVANSKNPLWASGWEATASFFHLCLLCDRSCSGVQVGTCGTREPAHSCEGKARPSTLRCQPIPVLGALLFVPTVSVATRLSPLTPHACPGAPCCAVAGHCRDFAFDDGIRPPVFLLSPLTRCGGSMRRCLSAPQANRPQDQATASSELWSASHDRKAGSQVKITGRRPRSESSGPCRCRTNRLQVASCVQVVKPHGSQPHWPRSMC